MSQERSTRGLTTLALVIVVLGTILLVGGMFLGIALIVWDQPLFDWSNEIKSERIGHLGDFVGGLIGTFISFFGILLFFLALMMQRKDLILQKESLDSQIEEFRQQTVQLAQTSQAHEAQLKNIEKQNFERVLFNLIDAKERILKSTEISTKGTGVRGVEEVIGVVRSNYSSMIDGKEYPYENRVDMFKESIYNAFNKFDDRLKGYFSIMKELFEFLATSKRNHLLDREHVYLFIRVLSAHLTIYELILLAFASFRMGIESLSIKHELEENGLLRNLNLYNSVIAYESIDYRNWMPYFNELKQHYEYMYSKSLDELYIETQQQFMGYS